MTVEPYCCQSGGPSEGITVGVCVGDKDCEGIKDKDGNLDGAVEGARLGKFEGAPLDAGVVDGSIEGKGRHVRW